MRTDPLLSPPSNISFPVGQHVIVRSADTATAALAFDSWVDLKLRAARWYLLVLQDLADSVGLDRLAGVEMALDGCLSNLSGAVDAALGRLILGLERQLGGSAVLEHQYNLRLAKSLALQAGGAPASVSRLGAALATDPAGVPTGWLAQLRRLRNRSTHHSTLSRHFEAEVHEPGAMEVAATVGLSVEGLPASIEPVAWLDHCLQRAIDICRDLLDDARATGHWMPDV